MVLDTSKFRAQYKIDENGKFAHYKEGPCVMCGKLTTQCDASLLWDGLVTYLCSDNCEKNYWNSFR